MKSKKLILALTMTITMGLGITAYAATESANTQTTTVTTANTSTNGFHMAGAGLGRATGMRGYDYVEAVLKDKLGMTDEEITAGFNSGKTMYDLAKEKGMTEDEFKTALLEERIKAIDKAVADGNITKEEGDSIKENLKNNMDNCTGIPGQGMKQSGTGYSSGRSAGGKRTGKGHMSADGSRGFGNCHFNDTSN